MRSRVSRLYFALVAICGFILPCLALAQNYPANSTGGLQGHSSAARFNFPRGLATDADGNVYVADERNSAVRKITPAGAVSTLAKLVGGNWLEDVALDSAGNIWIATWDGNILKRTPTGEVTPWTTLFGFGIPRAVATDGEDNLYVADTGLHRVFKITSAQVVTTLAGTGKQRGSADGQGATARFNQPYDLATDSEGNVYVADELNHVIRKITAAGMVTTLAGTAKQSGSADGEGSAARFDCPVGVATDSDGNIYVADSENHTIRKVTQAGVVTTLAGRPKQRGSADGEGSAARFNFPTGVVVDIGGNIYVADSKNHTIRKITSTGVVTTWAGRAGQKGSVDDDGKVMSR